jgi:hypothetical protein
MDQAIRAALKSQYRAALETVRDAIQQCPDDLWEERGALPPFWQIAYHAVFYAHFYMLQEHKGLRPWHKHRRNASALESDGEPAYTKADVLGYLDEVLASMAATLDSLNLATAESGFPWYRMPKLDHEILNIRHIMAHAGQLDAMLRQRGLAGVDWHA